MKKDQTLSGQLKKVERQEQKFLSQKENGIIKSKLAPIEKTVREKMPPRLKSALAAAFYSGFHLVFEKGAPYIEKTYDKEKLQLEHDLNNYALDRYLNSKRLKKQIKNIDRQSNRSKVINGSISALEGGVLGFLGIGLPDIPLLIAVIIRTLNETALSYGYRYDAGAEKAFILYLICGAVSEGDLRAVYDEKIELLGKSLDSDAAMEIDLEEVMRGTSDLLSGAILTAKFIQSLPVVGVIGGIVNPYIINKVGKYAGIKYKKRYLRGKMNGR